MSSIPSASNTRTGEVLVRAFEKSSNNFETYTKLHGKRIRQLCAGYHCSATIVENHELYLLHLSDTVIETHESSLKDLKAQSFAIGEEHVLCLSLDGDVYSWGKGKQGQLGLIQSIVLAKAPQKVRCKGLITQIACGRYHSAAVTNNGELWTWGRGVEGQTGHALAHVDPKINDAALDVQMVPKYVGAFLGKFVKGVSCGDDFTMAIIDPGEIWAFGEGRCGQLGSGKRMHKSPVKVIDKGFDRSPFKMVSCGSAHTLALTQSGQVYSWGLNTYGQLGLGDYKVRFQPHMVDAGFLEPVSSVAASGHRSMALADDGRAFLWGYQVGDQIEDDNSSMSNVVTPTLIKSLSKRPLAQIALSKDSALGYCPTKVCSVLPTSGPLLGGSRLSIQGTGFWESDDIVVRFAPVDPQGGLLPRSSVGSFVPSTGEITCQTPKFASPCSVIVEVSLNGKSFTSDGIKYDFYRVPKLRSCASKFLSVESPELLLLKCEGLVEARRNVIVRFQDLDHKDRFWDVEGLLNKIEEPSGDGKAEPEIQLSCNPPGVSFKDRPYVCAGVQVSYNGMDFEPPLAELVEKAKDIQENDQPLLACNHAFIHVVFHQVGIQSAVPNAVPQGGSSLGRITITGYNFFEFNRLVVKMQIREGEKTYTAQVEGKLESTEVVSFLPPPLEDFQEETDGKPISGLAERAYQRAFVKLSHDNGKTFPHAQEISLIYYNAKKVSVVSIRPNLGPVGGNTVVQVFLRESAGSLTNCALKFSKDCEFESVVRCISSHDAKTAIQAKGQTLNIPTLSGSKPLNTTRGSAKGEMYELFAFSPPCNIVAVADKEKTDATAGTANAAAVPAQAPKPAATKPRATDARKSQSSQGQDLTSRLVPGHVVQVQVALNGSEFAKDGVDFTFYGQPVIGSISPTEVSPGVTLEMSGDGLFEGAFILVRFTISETAQLVVPATFSTDTGLLSCLIADVPKFMEGQASCEIAMNGQDFLPTGKFVELRQTPQSTPS